MRLLFIGWGGHIHLRRWAGYFAGRGHRVHVFSTSGKAPPLPNAGMLPMRSINRGLPLQRLETALWCMLLQPDICHVHWLPFSQLVRYVWGVPIIITAWGSDIFTFSRQSERDQARVKRAVHRARALTCDSATLKEEIGKIGPWKGKTHVIQWGVDTGLFRPGLDASAWRRRLGISDSDFVLYSPRSLGEIYQIHTILKAFQCVLGDMTNVILLQKYYNVEKQVLASYQEAAHQLGITNRVRWLGEIPYDEIPFIYNLAHAMVSVPRWDGTPMALLEGMACGVPPVVSNVPSVLEWIKDGVNGWVVPIGDAKTLAQSIKKCIKSESLRKAFAEENIRLVAARASHSAHMAEAERLYRRYSRSGLHEQ